MKQTTNQVGNAKYRTFTKILLTAALLTISLAAFAPGAAAADPDPTPSGDACGTSVELSEAQVGTVGSDDPGDWYATPGPQQRFSYHPLTPGAGVQLERYNSDCELVNRGIECVLTVGSGITGDSCGAEKFAYNTGFGLVFGYVNTGLRSRTLTDGYIRIVPVDDAQVDDAAYQINTETPLCGPCKLP